MTKRKPIEAELLETLDACSLEELCATCRVEVGWIESLVEHGVVSPSGRTRGEWRFERVAIVRIAKARRLESDLGLNTPGIALALDLLDQIQNLQSRLRALESRPE